jgi:glycerophosphoryl diester phosphodiesterase
MLILWSCSPEWTGFRRQNRLIIGHRGASADAPENTLAAFRLARAQGAEGIEFDVQLSADGWPVVMHDDDVARTTDGEGQVTAHEAGGFEGADAG